MGTITPPHYAPKLLIFNQQVMDMEVVIPPRLMARKEGQMAEVLLQDTVVRRKGEVKILQVAQRHANWRSTILQI